MIYLILMKRRYLFLILLIALLGIGWCSRNNTEDLSNQIYAHADKSQKEFQSLNIEYTNAINEFQDKYPNFKQFEDLWQQDFNSLENIKNIRLQYKDVKEIEINHLEKIINHFSDDMTGLHNLLSEIGKLSGWTLVDEEKELMVGIERAKQWKDMFYKHKVILDNKLYSIINIMDFLIEHYESLDLASNNLDFKDSELKVQLRTMLLQYYDYEEKYINSTKAIKALQTEAKERLNNNNE